MQIQQPSLERRVCLGRGTADMPLPILARRETVYAPRIDGGSGETEVLYAKGGNGDSGPKNKPYAMGGNGDSSDTRRRKPKYIN